MTTRQITRADLDRRTTISDLTIGQVWAFRDSNDPATEPATILEIGGLRGQVKVRFQNGVEATVRVSTLRHPWPQHEAYGEAERRWFTFAQHKGPGPAEFEAAARVADHALDRNVASIVDGQARGSIGVADEQLLLELAGLTSSDIAGESWFTEDDTTYYSWETTQKIITGLLKATPRLAREIITHLREDAADGRHHTDTPGNWGEICEQATTQILAWSGASPVPPESPEQLTIAELAQLIRTHRSAPAGQSQAANVSDLVLAERLLDTLTITLKPAGAASGEGTSSVEDVKAGQKWEFRHPDTGHTVTAHVVNVADDGKPYPITIRVSGEIMRVSPSRLGRQIEGGTE